MRAELVGGHVQRITATMVAGRHVAMVDVRVPGETIHVVLVGGMGVGVIDAQQRDRWRRASAAPPSSSQDRWRAHISGARVLCVTERAVELARDDLTWLAESGRDGSLRLEQREMGEMDTVGRDTLERRGAAIVRDLERSCDSGRREALQRALAASITRVDRRATAVRGDLARAQAADEAACRAQLFVAEASRAPRGATKLVATDWTSGEALEVELRLDPARSAREQVEALFRRARRLKEGAKIAQARLAETEAAREKLARIFTELAAADCDFDVLEARARAAAPRDLKLPPRTPATRGHARRNVARPPFRTFLGPAGALILVGRGAAQNDELTMHVARPHDLWLHAKNHAGSHVIVRLHKGSACPADVLVEAAHLAVHFSDAHDEPMVEVQYTPRRYLRKPRGSAPGLVVVDREKVILLRREDQVLRKLLDAEVIS
jgi:hypothetical protein